MEKNNEAVSSLDKLVDRTDTKTFFRKRQGCPVCISNIILDYKNPLAVSKYTSENGRILPRRITSICSKHQKQLKQSVKIARMLSILPFC